MRRRELILASGGVAATALAGCLGGVGDDQPGEGPTVEERTDRTITVSNVGEVTGEPDLAVLELAVESTGDTAGEVRDDLATRSDAVRTALLEAGLDEEDVTTEHFRIHERVDRRAMERDGVRPDSKEAREEYVHYRGTHSFRVEVPDVDRVGEVIDTAVDAGVDEVGRVTFTLSEERRAEKREEALRAAIQGAEGEAEAIAEEVGATLEEAEVVDASGGRVSPVHREFGGDGGALATPVAESAPSTGVEAGDVTVRATVRVRYRMA